MVSLSMVRFYLIYGLRFSPCCLLMDRLENRLLVGSSLIGLWL